MGHNKASQVRNKKVSSSIEASEKGDDIWRDCFNTPAFLKMMPDVSDLSGLDIGCGDGNNARLIAKKCKHLTAIDVSDHFSSYNKKNNVIKNLSFEKMNATSMSFPNENFDFVVSTMSMMDIADLDKVLAEIYRVLSPAGFLQFSIIHPCFNENKGEWVKDKEGNLEKPHVPMVSKPLSKWFSALTNAGFIIDSIYEPHADEEAIKLHPQLSSTKNIAHSLIIRARKNESYKEPLRKIIDKLPGNVWWKSNKLVYLGCNDRVIKMLGLSSRKDLIGKTDHELWRKDIADKLKIADMHVLTTGESISLEEEIVQKDGSQAIMLTNKSPLFGENGEIIAVIGTSTDITERKAENKILQYEKEQAQVTLNNIVANMPGHVYWKDRDGVYLGCNNRQAESLGLRYGSDVINKTDFDLPWEKNVATAFRENDIRVMQTGITEIIEEESQINGKKAIVLSQKTPLRNKENEVIGILGISIDITERKQFEADLKIAKEKAEIANKAKTEFLENMRHDIRTPLTGITGFASIIKDEAKDPKIKEYVDNLNASSYALLDFLNEILDVIKLNSGELPVSKKKFDLRKRLDDVVTLNQAKAHHKGIQLIFDYDKNIPSRLIGDSTRIHRVVLELIVNGLNFTRQGFVSLTTQLAKTEDNNVVIKIVVEDTGVGIESEKQQEIFLQFKRLTPSYEGLYKGAGLGLAIVKQFIEELKGEIYVESKVGEGTKFTCIIPMQIPLLDEEFGTEEIATPSRLRKHEAIALKQNEVTNNGKISTNKSRILVVEDNVIAATVVSNMLSSLNCQIDVAEDGKKAVQLAQENEYDLVFMDIGLPGIDGYEATRRIRLIEQNKGTHIPIIALTAHVDEENKQRCLEIGMNAVIAKPLAKDRAEDILNAFIPYRKKQEGSHVIESENETRSLEIEGAVIDSEYALKILNNDKAILHELLKMLIESFPNELKQLDDAYKIENWTAIREIAHKLKGSSTYVGTIRLKEACDFLESAIKRDDKSDAHMIYKKMLEEISAIEEAVKNKSY